MTIYEIIDNKNIRSDRYAMAAISCIFKAFGDHIRSKEYWPWGDKVQCSWTPTKGTIGDIIDAEFLLERALEKYEDELNNSTQEIYIKSVNMDECTKQIRELKKRLNKVKVNTNKIIKTNKNTIDTSIQTEDTINKLVQ